jgi:hypothetical protein
MSLDKTLAVGVAFVCLREVGGPPLNDRRGHGAMEEVIKIARRSAVHV